MTDFLARLLGVDRAALEGAEWHFRFNSPPVGAVVFVVTVLVLLFVSWVYFHDGRQTASRPFRFGLGLLRVLLLAIALLILTDPVFIATRTEQKPSTVLVLIDDSHSMGLKFAYADEKLRQIVVDALGKDYKVKVQRDGKTAEIPAGKLDVTDFGQLSRLQVACQALRRDSPDFVARLHKEHPKVKVYTFSRFYQPPGGGEAKATPAAGQDTPDLSKDLEPRAPETRIGEVLRLALKENRGDPVAGVVVVSDGRQTGGEDPVQVVSAQYKFQRIPVFTVGVGDPSEPKDVEVTADGPDVIMPEDKAEVVANVRMLGYPKLGPIRVELKREDGKVVASESVTLTRPGEKIPVSLKFEGSKPGRYSYSIEIPKQEGEMRDENNRAIYSFQVVDKKVRVLFVEGTDLPRWEYRFLKNALIRDHTIEADVLLATSGGGGGDLSFIYDGSPIPDKRKLDSFPVNRKEMGEYDVLILGDVDPGMFTYDEKRQDSQVKLIEWFVREGGGLIVIAGERFAPAAWSKCKPLVEMLPIIPTQGYQASPDGLNDPFKVTLTEEGKKMAWTHFDADPAQNVSIWDNLPHQYWHFPVKKAKSGAAVVAVHPTVKDEGGKPMPLIVLGQYGGRVLYVGVDSLWRWRMGIGDRFHYKFYSQAMRYLVSGRRQQKRIRMDVDKSAYVIGDRVILTAHLKDDKGEPEKRDKAIAHLKTPKGETQNIELVRRKDLEGTYEYQFYPNLRGQYGIVMTEDDKPDLNPVESLFKVDLPLIEMDNPRMNEELLRNIAAAGGEGGQYVSVDRIGDVPPLIKMKKDEITREDPPRALWDNWLVLLLFTILITLEWVLRKRGRML